MGRDPLVDLAIEIAADGPIERSNTSHLHERTMIRRELLNGLRAELDDRGLGREWRIRAQEMRRAG